MSDFCQEKFFGVELFDFIAAAQSEAFMPGVVAQKENRTPRLTLRGLRNVWLFLMGTNGRG
jgi:hypothetical protein